MKKLIFLTWTERRSHSINYGKIVAVLWVREGNGNDVRSARAYAKAQKGDHRVHVFPAASNFAEAKREAIEAHPYK